MKWLQGKKMDVGYALVTGLDYSIPGQGRVGFPNIINLSGVSNNKTAIDLAKKITREKYEATKIPHHFALLKDGIKIAETSSPSEEDQENLPLCDFCWKDNKVNSALYKEIYTVGRGQIVKYACRQHKIGAKILKVIDSRFPTTIINLPDSKPDPGLESFARLLAGEGAG